MTKLPQVLILGAKGRLGKAFSRFRTIWPGYNVVPIFDKLYDDDFLYDYGVGKGDIIINCAAYTDVAKSDTNEEEFQKCQRTNTFFPHLLSIAAKELRFKLVLFSTDYTIREEFQKNHYTISKKNMEELCFNNALIIRVSNLIGREDKKNSNLVLKLLSQKSPIQVIDGYVYPTLINDDTIDKLNTIILTKSKGIINFFGEEYWLPDFTEKLFWLGHKDIKLDINLRRKIGTIKKRYIANKFDWKELKKWLNS